MGALFRYEGKAGLKSFLIWVLFVGGMGLCCILLFKSMEESMAEMAENFASMGAFSEAFGMSTLSIATAKGFFATEVGTIHALGGSMFAASIATVILSKEEDGHMAEFTYTMPLSRGKVVVVKLLSVLASLVSFTLVCGIFYCLGFAFIGEEIPMKEMLCYLLSQLLMNLEIAAICVLISSVSKKNRLGVGIGIAMTLYLFDLIARVIPDLKDIIFLSPFAYANATEIFARTIDQGRAIVFGVEVIIVCIVSATMIYTTRDLAS